MAKIEAHTATGVVNIDGENGRKLVLILEDNGVDILHRCGGNARCTTCRVELLEGDAGERNEAENAILTTKGVTDSNIRLSCQIRVSSDLTVKVINQASVAGIDPGGRPVE
jgi:ferredoxin